MQANHEDRTVATLRSVSDGDLSLAAPPDDRFDRIAAEAFGDGGESLDEAAEPTPGSGGVPPRPPSQPAEVVDLSARRAKVSRTTTVIASVAAGLLLVAGVAGVLVRNDTRTEVVASAELDLLAGNGTASANLVEREDGTYMVLDVSDLEASGDADFYELWLLAPDVSDMASLTRFDIGTGTIEVEVPEGVDPGEWPVVDISEELDDGDDTHSGLSILRGTLA